MRGALLLFSVLLSVPAQGADGEQKSAEFVEAVTKYCKPFETVDLKGGRLEADGWSDMLDQSDMPPAMRIEGFESLRIFRAAKTDLFISIGAPDADHNYVRDCSVDGVNYDSKQIIALAINNWGTPVQSPEQTSIWYWAFTEPVAHRIIVSKSRAGFQDRPDTAIALTVRFDPLKTFMKEE